LDVTGRRLCLVPAMIKSVVAPLSTLTEESRRAAEVAEETFAEDGIRERVAALSTTSLIAA
jgi:hypothetical protein